MSHVEKIEACEVLQPIELDDIAEDAPYVAVLESIVPRFDGGVGREDALLAHLGNGVGQGLIGGEEGLAPIPQQERQCQKCSVALVEVIRADRKTKGPQHSLPADPAKSLLANPAEPVPTIKPAQIP